MDLKILAINTISVLTGAVIIYIFCIANYNIRPPKHKLALFFTIYTLTIGITSTYLSFNGDIFNILKPFIILFESIFFIVIFLNIKIGQALIVYIIYVLCTGIGNVIIPKKYSMDYIEDNPIYYFFTNSLCNLFAFIVMLAVKPIRKLVSKILVHKTSLPILLITFIITAANYGIQVLTKNFNWASYIMILSSSILYCIYLLAVSSRLIKNETLKLEAEQQRFYNESLNSTLFNLRRFKHDWKNNLAVINSMLIMNKIDDLKVYMSELIDASNHDVNTAIYNIKNAGLFGIITSKMNHAKEIGVEVDFNMTGEIEDIPGIKISELCEIIGIFVDNAIEEASNGDRKICINIYSYDKFIEISISNSCTSSPDMKLIYEAGVSSKGNGRGMGLAIAKKIINEYKNIEHICNYEDNTFTQTITIEKGL
jgi:two-component system sensor histidine kinase AgrC